MSPKAGNYFTLIKSGEADWNLFRLSVEICRIVDPELCFDTYNQFIDQLAGECRKGIEENGDVYSTIEAINSVLYDRYGFHGNEEDYYDPRNSYMTSVLDRRKGIPITLSVLYREISSRIGLDLTCVALPGHFLLKLRHSGREMFIDAYSAGKILLASECRQLVEEIYDGQVEFKPGFLQRIGKKTVLLRLLVNLKQIYQAQGDHLKLIAVLDHRIPLLIDPNREILERGLTRLSVEDYRGAADDIRFFMDHTDDTEIKEALGAKLDRIRRLARGY